MTLRKRLLSIVLVCGMVPACQSPESSGTIQQQSTTRRDQPGPRNTTVSAPPPVTYALCSENLPTTGQWKGDPVIQDINGDGIPDLAAHPRLGNGPHIWYGDGNGRWTEAFAGWEQRENSCGGGLVFKDVNGDDRLDLCIADHCRGIFVYLGDGEGGWTVATKNLFPADLVTTDLENQTFLGSEDLDVGDVNGDGFPDIIASASDESGISMYLGDGTGTNWTRRPGGLPDSAWANRVMLRDMNKDGVLDLVATHADGPRVWHNDGKGNWTAASTGLPEPVIRGLYTGIAVADMNGDGRLDIATANWVDGPEVYLQQSDNTWKKLPDVFPEMLGGAIGLEVADLDQDGNVDIVVSGQIANEPGYVRGVFALRGDGKGHFTYMEHNGLPKTGLMTTMGIALGDVNGDGLPDIAAGSGMTVERVPSGPKGPVVEPRLLMWCSQPTARSAALTSEGQNRQGR